MIVAVVENFGGVERLVLLHLALHYVLHYARVPVLTSLLVGQVVLLGVVEQGLAGLILFGAVSKFIGLAALARIVRVALTCLILRLFAAISVLAVLCGALGPADWHLIDQDHFRKFRSDL